MVPILSSHTCFSLSTSQTITLSPEYSSYLAVTSPHNLIFTIIIHCVSTHSNSNLVDWSMKQYSPIYLPLHQVLLITQPKYFLD